VTQSIHRRREWVAAAAVTVAGKPVLAGVIKRK
jgi:hypothetical protein